MNVRNYHVIGSLCLTISVLAPASFAQIVATLDEESFFVLNGFEEMIGVDIRSESGGLVPVPDNDAAPFTILLQNTETNIVWGNLGSTVTLEGSLRLNARWNTNHSTQDVQMQWGDGPTPRDIILAENFYELGGPCNECPVPPLKVSMNDDHRVVLSGSRNEITEITFRSPSNSLHLPDSSAPFAELTTNTSSEVTFSSPGSHVTVEGDVTLGVGWNDHLYERDISYDYQVLGGGRSQTKTFPNRDYNLPSFGRLDVWVNDDDQFVISGSGQPITGLSLTSSSGSLVPGENPAPFGSFEVNTPSNVSLKASGNALTLDGQVTLDTKWDWKDRSRRVTVDYELLGDVRDERFTLLGSKFPDVPIPGREPLLITLDDQNNFVITGFGQEINGIEIQSPSGALTLSEESTAPFPHLLLNTTEQITLGVLGSVVVDGSFVMDFGLSDPALLDELIIDVGYGRTPILNPANELCNRCDLPQVSVSPDRGLILTDFPDPITEIRFLSPNGGLTSFEPPEGVSIASSSPTELVVTSENGFDAEIMQGLAVAWGAPQDFGVFVSFSLVDGRSFGPFQVGLSAPVVPEPSTMPLLLGASIPLLHLRRRKKSPCGGEA